MIFNSVDFLIFFPVVTLIYFIVPKKARYVWLLLASYFFYMCWNVKYALLLLTSTVITWLCARMVYAAKKPVLKTDSGGMPVCKPWDSLFLQIF